MRQSGEVQEVNLQRRISSAIDPRCIIGASQEYHRYEQEQNQKDTIYHIQFHLKKKLCFKLCKKRCSEASCFKFGSSLSFSLNLKTDTDRQTDRQTDRSGIFPKTLLLSLNQQKLNLSFVSFQELVEQYVNILFAFSKPLV